MGDFIDFTLSNARRFYSSKGENLAAKGLTSGSAIEIQLNASGVKGKLFHFGVASGAFKSIGHAKF